MKAALLASLAGSALAAPFSFPLSNGFPSLSQSALADVEKQAGGTLPNSGLPSGISDDLAVSFSLIAANELFEVAYFTELYHNITNSVPGYEVTDENLGRVIAAVRRIRAQEELHATGANAILAANNRPTIGPCKYQFPVSDYKSAIKLANTFTDVVIGVLPVVQTQSTAVVPLIGAIEEQEAQQVGWFRWLSGKSPSAAPFLTSTTPEFALSAISGFLVPGSCPSTYASIIEANVKSFPALTVTKAPTEHSQKASYSVQGTIDSSSQEIAYISGQNTPVTVAITNLVTKNGVSTFDADFPAEADGFADGLTVAAVVAKSAAPFSKPADVAAATAYGPGLIEYL